MGHQGTISGVPGKAAPACSGLQPHLALAHGSPSPRRGTFQAKRHTSARSMSSSGRRPHQFLLRTGGGAVGKGTSGRREQREKRAKEDLKGPHVAGQSLRGH